MRFVVCENKAKMKEVRVLRKLNHKYIVRLRNAFVVDSTLVIVMEFAGGGELKGYVDQQGRLEEPEARRIFRQLIDAISYCHTMKVVHRDLKLENVLFSDPDRKRIKVVDFGIAGLALDSQAEKSKAGSLRYMAPEVLTGANIEAHPALDVWSLGCMLFAMICGELPFSGKTSAEVVERIKKGEFQFPHSSNVSYYCRKLIRSMLTVEYQKRISMGKISRHPWMAGESRAESSPSRVPRGCETVIHAGSKKASSGLIQQSLGLAKKRVLEDVHPRANHVRPRPTMPGEANTRVELNPVKKSFHFPHINPLSAIKNPTHGRHVSTNCESLVGKKDTGKKRSSFLRPGRGTEDSLPSRFSTFVGRDVQRRAHSRADDRTARRSKA